MNFEHIDMTALEAELIAFRRDLHCYPEAAWTEFRTTARIIRELEQLGLPVEYGPSIHVREKMFGLPSPEIMNSCYERAEAESAFPEYLEKMRGGYTGCVTRIRGALPGPTVGIRVDIDCNEVEETGEDTHLPAALGFRSRHPGCMHACGHDAHAAIGVGTAKILSICRDRLHGTVVLVFQPGEEGLRGAASMTAAGVFRDCDIFFGGHVGLVDGLSVGTVAASARGFLASTKLDAVFRGVPAHAGASPERGQNAMAAAATAVLNLLAIPRHSGGPTRINIGTLRAGSGRNVIPAEAELSLETRGGSTALNAYMEASAKRVLQAAADMYDCTLETRFMGSAGDVTCDPELTRWTAGTLMDIPGVEKVLPEVYLGVGEDVTTIIRDVQSRGGQGTELIFGMPLKAPHHNDHFDVDEKVILSAARVFADLALELGEGRSSYEAV